MTDTTATDQPQTLAAAAVTRLPWVAPRIQTVAAGEAEEGTRPTSADGAFTTS